MVTALIIVSILGVIGTWVGVIFAYMRIKKENQRMVEQIVNFFNSGEINSRNKSNLQVGKSNKNEQ